MKTEIDWLRIVQAELPFGPERIKAQNTLFAILAHAYKSADELVATLRCYHRRLKKRTKFFGKWR
ncbi:MAG: hypothetical protein WC761_06115 [Candidatus Paceibacterota bacterium]|jgi:hypothetical protein